MFLERITTLHACNAVRTQLVLSYGYVVKATVFLTDINDFSAMNEVYAKYFSEPYPARSAVGVKDLPKGVKIEIEVIAHKL